MPAEFLSQGKILKKVCGIRKMSPIIFQFLWDFFSYLVEVLKGALKINKIPFQLLPLKIISFGTLSESFEIKAFEIEIFEIEAFEIEAFEIEAFKIEAIKIETFKLKHSK